jgi:hypothetical protein
MTIRKKLFCVSAVLLLLAVVSPGAAGEEPPDKTTPSESARQFSDEPAELATENEVIDEPPELVAESEVADEPAELTAESEVVDEPPELVAEDEVIDEPAELATEDEVADEPAELATESEVADEPAKLAAEREPTPQRSAAKRWWEPISVGAGLEANNNNPKGMAYGALVSVGYRLFRFFALGVKGEFNSNFGTSNTIEAAAWARFVFPIKRLELFAQGSAGISSIIIYGDTETRFLYEGGAGVRIPIKKFYLEPFARFGLPFLWGAGVVFGYSWKR